MSTTLAMLFESITDGVGKAWQLVPLGDVLTERQETPDPTEIEFGEIPIIGKISFHSGQIELRSETKTNTKMILIRPGDLVASGINAAKGAIAIYPEDAASAAAATIHYVAYEVEADRANRSFLWWLLRSNLFKDILTRHLPGGIKTELKAERLLPIPIPLPPLKEQQRIVAKLENLAAKIDEAHGLRHLSGVEADALLKAVLNALSDTFVELGTLNQVLHDKPRNGWSARCDNFDDGVPVLTLSAVTGYEYNAAAFKRTSLPTDEHAHYWLRPGDLLITRSNTPALVGHAAIYNGEPVKCIYPDLMMRVPVNEKLANKRFVWFWLQTPQVREYIKANAKGTSPTMKKISQGTVMDIPFPNSLPLEEQRRIVTDLDCLQAKLDRFRALQQKVADELDAILPSVLDKAFKGEL